MHTRSDGLDIEWLGVLPVDPVTGTAQPGEVTESLVFGRLAGHVENLPASIELGDQTLRRGRPKGLLEQLGDLYEV
jgi:hypothetical protein